MIIKSKYKLWDKLWNVEYNLDGDKPFAIIEVEVYGMKIDVWANGSVIIYYRFAHEKLTAELNLFKTKEEAEVECDIRNARIIDYVKKHKGE